MIKEFVEGWMNLACNKLGLSNESVETLAKERAKICLVCPLLSKVNLVCGDCYCPIEAKIRSKSSFCPQNKW